MSNSTLNLILASNQPILFKSLLQKDDIDYKELLYYLLRNSSTEVAKDTDIVQSIYTRLKFNKRKTRSLLNKAFLFGFIELIRSLLPEIEDNTKIRNVLQCNFSIASKDGDIETVKMLLADPKKRVDPGAKKNYAIRWASSEGHTRVVRLLLADPRVDPSADNNDAIQWASHNGHTKVVKLLLADPKRRVDPSADDNLAIQWASMNSHTEVVKLLLADPKGRVDPSAEDNYAIRKTSTNGRFELVKLLLADPRVDPSAWNNRAIQNASKNSYPEVVRLLSIHPKLAHSKQLDITVLTIIVKAWLNK